MSVGYRNNAGFDFDAIFQPGDLQAPGFRKSDGTNLRYAPRGTTPKAPDVGYRDALGNDLSNLWQILSLIPVPDYNGRSYSSTAQAPTGQSGDTRATVRLQYNADGTWSIVRIRTGSTQNGTTVLASGTWRATGDESSAYTVRFSAGTGSGQGVVVNSAPTATSLATGQSIALYAEVPAASGSEYSDLRPISVVLTKGSEVVNTSCGFSVRATGWL